MSLINNALKIADNVLDAASDGFQKGLTALASGATSAASNVYEWVKSVVHDAVYALGNGVDAFNKVIHDAWSDFNSGVHWLEHGLDDIANVVGDGFDWLVNVKFPFINFSLDDLANSLKTSVDWLINEINIAYNNAVTLANNGIETATNWINDNLIQPIWGEVNALSKNLGATFGYVDHYLLHPDNLADIILDPLLALIARTWQSVGKKAGDYFLGIVLSSGVTLANVVESVVADFF